MFLMWNIRIGDNNQKLKNKEPRFEDQRKIRSFRQKPTIRAINKGRTGNEKGEHAVWGKYNDPSRAAKRLCSQIPKQLLLKIRDVLTTPINMSHTDILYATAPSEQRMLLGLETGGETGAGRTKETGATGAGAGAGAEGH